MNVIITSAEQHPGGFYFQASCEKVSAYVSITRLGYGVTCQNSSHRVWKGVGRQFDTFEQALEGYKSAEMQAIIQACEDYHQKAA